MKWHDHPMMWKALGQHFGYRGDATSVIKSVQSRGLFKDRAMWNSEMQLMIEMWWTQEKRPYYDLYPSVAEAFTKVDLAKVTFAQLKLPLPQLLIRMPVGRELDLSPRTKLRSLLIGEYKGATGYGWLTAINDGSTLDGFPVHTVNGMLPRPEDTIADKLRHGREHPYCADEIDDEAVDNALRIVAAICLLKDSPDLIEPQPLASDIDKWNATHDMSLIKKAERRGKRGWSVGAHIETAPGFRRPHFAIRWCGKGRTDPRLRPIKGCLVHRRKIEEVPTDWLGPEVPTPS